ncbi:hypothetical protein ABZ746_37530 [Streptomyces sp. NPDC020096]
MSPKHGPRRAEVRFRSVAEAQIAKFNDAEFIAADRAIVAVSTNPLIGEPVAHDLDLHEYREPGTGVRLFYRTADLNNRIIVVYIEA